MSTAQVRKFRNFYDKIIQDTKSAKGNPLFQHADEEIAKLIRANPTWTSEIGILTLSTVTAKQLNGKIALNNGFIKQYNEFIDLLVAQRFITAEMAVQVKKVEKEDKRKNKAENESKKVSPVGIPPSGVNPEKLFGLAESKAVTPPVEIKEAPAKPVELVATAEPAVDPTPLVAEVKEAKRKPNMAGLIKRREERKRQLSEMENKFQQDLLNAPLKPKESKKKPSSNLAQLIAEQSGVLEQKTKVPRPPQMVRQQTPEQFLQENLDEFVESGKEREEKEQPLTTGRSFANRMIDAIGSLTFSGLFAVLSTYATRTNNKDLGRFIAPLGGALGSIAYKKISEAKEGLGDILEKVSQLGGSPDDIIKSAKQEGKQARRPDIRPEDDEPPAPAGRPEGPPQRLVDEVKAERPPMPPKPRVRMTDSEMKDMIDSVLKEKRPLDSMMDKKTIPQVTKELVKDTGRGAYSIASGLGTGARGVVEGVLNSAISAVANQIYETVNFDNGDYGQDVPDYILPRSMEGKIPIRAGARVEYYDLGQPADPNENVFLDRPEPEIKEGMADARDYDGSRPASSIRDRIERAGRVAQDLAQNRNVRIGAGVAGVGAVGAGIASTLGGASTIKESPIVLKNEELNQDQAQNIKEGKDKDEIRRGAGLLKPKFIVPSVNIFNKTEQEQYVDDIEFAMFDFVQDDSGGNDPTGTNPILRDQNLSKGLRYQNSGVTVNSLYGQNLPDNPKNMTQAMMDELFLGEPLLPTMKFLFSEEFYPQEFNLSEFEVNNYDVNNELTAIEMLSPYAQFTNNQLLDQFIDTSILYGVVP